MKKLIAVLLLLTMVVSLFAGCKKDDNTPDTNALKDAVAYLTNMYQTAGKGEAIVLEADLDVINVVVIAGESYSVEWSVEITSGTEGSVTVGESKEANHVKLDITEKNSEEVTFTATATVKDAEGNSEKVSFDYKVPAVKLAGDGMTMEELVEAAYALENGATMEGLATLKGVITAINTPWDSGYKNITVTIQIGELADKPIKCYRLSGEGADSLGIGDTITVSGSLTNYNGVIEFAQGCIVEEIVKSEEPAPEAPKDPAEIVNAAYALEPGTSLPYEASLTGVITEIATPWDEGYQNITVIIQVGDLADKPIKCYRLKGEGAADLAVGDTITSTGYLTNYNGEIEFAAGCVVSNIVKGNGETPENPDNTEKPDDQPQPEKPTTDVGVIDTAYGLAEGQQTDFEVTVTGKVVSVDDAYDAEYKNITVTIQVAGRESKPLKVYRMKGDGADKLAKGDTITVTGKLKNHYGTIELVFGVMSKRVAGGNKPVTQETDPAKILAAAGKLAENEELPYDVTLSGKITKVDDAYDAEYKNITVTIAVSGANNAALKCFRLKGDDAAKLAEGDTITVKGRIKNYFGELELVNGTITARTAGGNKPITQLTDPAKIVDAAYALGANKDLGYDVTLTGKVTAIKTAYDANYKNISVVMEIKGRESKPIVAFRMKGDGVDKIVVGDTITVTGRLKNYVPEGKTEGTIEFDAGCKMDKRVSGGVTAPTDPKEIVKAAYALEGGKSLPYTATLTGKITKINTEYDAKYNNITVTIVVDGCEDMPMKCFRLKGEGAESLKVGDVITVSGIIKNYVHSSGDSEIEFDAGCTLK